jgi:hypothetical protein
MEYIKKYHAIANSMLDFEKQGCDFYLSLATEPTLRDIEKPLRQTGYEKAGELDILSGMITVSSFLLADCKLPQHEPEETIDWLEMITPRIYNDITTEKVVTAGSPQRALDFLVELEGKALAYYTIIRQKITMDSKLIDSLISRQKKRISCLCQTMTYLQKIINTADNAHQSVA